MLDKHELQLNGENGLSPRVENLEKWKEIAESELAAMKKNMEEMKLGQADLKNTVNRVENTIVAALNSQTSTLDKVLTYSLEIKKTTEETDRALINAKKETDSTLINAKTTEKVARFSTTEKIVGSVFGVGGLAGLITGIVAIWP